MNRNRNGQTGNRFQRRYHPYRHELQVGTRNNAENPLIRLCKESIPEGGDVLALQLTYQLQLFSKKSTAGGPPADVESSENNENDDGGVNIRRNLSSESSMGQLSSPSNRNKSPGLPVSTPSSSTPMGRLQVSQSSVGTGNNNFGSNYAHYSGSNVGNGDRNRFGAETPRSQFVTPRSQFLTPRSQVLTPRSQFVTPVRNTVEQFSYPSPSASRPVTNVPRNVFTPSHRSQVTPASYNQRRLNDDSKST